MTKLWLESKLEGEPAEWQEVVKRMLQVQSSQKEALEIQLHPTPISIERCFLLDQDYSRKYCLTVTTYKGNPETLYQLTEINGHSEAFIFYANQLELHSEPLSDIKELLLLGHNIPAGTELVSE